jgi:hypothetical protein
VQQKRKRRYGSETAEKYYKSYRVQAVGEDIQLLGLAQLHGAIRIILLLGLCRMDDYRCWLVRSDNGVANLIGGGG